jgi:hypothetical protein
MVKSIFDCSNCTICTTLMPCFAREALDIGMIPVTYFTGLWRCTSLWRKIGHQPITDPENCIAFIHWWDFWRSGLWLLASQSAHRARPPRQKKKARGPFAPGSSVIHARISQKRWSSAAFSRTTTSRCRTGRLRWLLCSGGRFNLEPQTRHDLKGFALGTATMVDHSPLHFT